MTDPETIATYEAVAEEYRERHGDREAVAGIVEAFLAALDDAQAERSATAPARVLDVGCGPGWESATFAEAGYDVFGIDVTNAFLDAASDTAPDGDFARMDMRRLGIAEDAFAGLWACASFLHVPREAAPATLEGFSRVLEPSGVLALTVKRGDGRRDGDAYEADEREFVLYQPTELRGLVADAGFDIERVDADEENWMFLLARV
ncbi:class I SAM-dependent methyltransferase [Salinarchaeum chitinilyticum]